MSFAVGIIILLLGVVLSIGLHEIGHMLPAKLCGVKVPEYSIGFGPTLWKTRRGETTYFVKAIPLGGYVRMAGMLPPAKGAPKRDANGYLSWAEEAREEARKDIGPGEEHRAFSALAAWKKLIIMFGGPVTNWLLAGIILAIVFAGLGTAAYTPRLTSVPECVASAECENPDAPGYLAGLEEGDLIVSWGGTAVESWADVTDAIRSGGTEATSVVVERDGKELTLTVTPQLTEREILDNDGDVVTAEVPFVGISPSIELQRQSLAKVPGVLWQGTTATASVVTSLPIQLWNTVQSLLGNEPDADREVISLVGVGQMAGSITSAESESYTLAMRAVDMLSLLASLNLALFVFNMIPLLPLDGGHIAGALWEGIRRAFAKVTGRPDPGPVDLAPLMKVGYWVLGALVLMTVILMWADIVSPIAG